MQLRLICLLLIVVLSSSTASSGFIGSRSLLTVLAQHDQLHKLVKDEKGGQNEGNMQNGDDYMYRTSNKNALFTPRGSKFPFKSTSAYFFRGGQAMNKNEKKSPLKSVIEALDQVKPATRVYLLMCLFCTLVHITGLPAPAMFGLQRDKILEIWRPLTAMSYLGGPSMSMANSLYFLVRYGQTLETMNGTGSHTWFLIVQTMLLTLLGLLLGFPFQAQAMISAAVYASSQVSPLDKVPFQFGLTVTAWQLPFGMMIIDCLSQQNAAAAWPHILGIFSGHFFHFFSKIWPALGGKAWLKEPEMLTKMLGGKPSSGGIDGIDFAARNAKKKKNKGNSKSTKSAARKKKPFKNKLKKK